MLKTTAILYSSVSRARCPARCYPLLTRQFSWQPSMPLDVVRELP